MIERGSPGVMEVIAERMRGKHPWHNRGDPYKLALVAEGGAMRTVIAGGMAKALNELGFTDVFDAIYGVSAGAATGAYFLSRQTEAISIFYKLINNTRFIDPLRFTKNLPIVDIPYLTYNVMKYQMPLDWQKVVDSPIPLHVYVASAKDARTVDFHTFKNQDDILDALHYACRIPVAAGMPISVGNRFYTDAGATTGGISYREALADGCTHMLVLVTDSGAQKSSDIAGYCGFMILQKNFPKYGQALLHMSQKYRQVMREIDAASPQVRAIRTPRISMSLLETNGGRLKSAGVEGYKATIQAFGKKV